MRAKRIYRIVFGLWALIGVIAALPWLVVNSLHRAEIAPIAFLPLLLLAIPFYFIDSRFGTKDVTEGLFWATGHSPPFLNPLGIFVVYFIPAFVGIVWSFRRPSKTEPKSLQSVPRA